MLENLSKTDYIILFILALIIFIAGIVLVVFIKKSKKTTVLDKVLENEEQEEPKKIKKAEVGMKLACENIPPLEEKKPEIGMKLACENIPQLEEKKEKVNIDNEEVFKTKEEITNDFSLVPVANLEKNDEKEEEKQIELEEVKPVELNETKIEDIESDPDTMEEQVIYINNNNIEKNQDEKNKTNIDEILKAMQVDLEKEKYATIDQYEEEQEEEAVVSYQELRKKMQQKEEEVKAKLMKDAMKKMEEQKPIYEDIESIPSYSNDDFFDILDKNESANKVRTEDDLYNNYRESIKDSYIFEKRKKENVDKQKNNEFISPVFGRQEFTGEYRNIEKPKKEVKRQREKLHDLDETDAFLNTLKEFRNNL